MKYIVAIYCLAVFTTTNAQKKIEKVFNASGINSVVVEGTIASEITFIAAKSNTIKVVTNVAGEYFENLVLEMYTEANALLIKPNYRPFFKKHNDKLAAHKVISVAIKVYMPQNLYVSVTSQSGTIKANGIFDLISAETRTGVITLTNFTGEANLKTFSGNIVVSAKATSTAKGKSKYGSVINKLPQSLKPMIFAETNTGNIELLETK